MPFIQQIDTLFNTDTVISISPEEQGQTIIHCTYTATDEYLEGGWVNISPTTFLVNPVTQETLQLQFAYHVPLAPDKHFFQQSGQRIRFLLIFPNLPKDWATFNFIEETDDGTSWKVTNIFREPQYIYWLTFH